MSSYKELQKENEVLRKELLAAQEMLQTPTPIQPPKTSVFVIKYKFYEIFEGKKRNYTGKICIEARTKREALKHFSHRVANGLPVECYKLDLDSNK